MTRERVFTIGDAKQAQKSKLDPCRSCDLEPTTCGKLMPVHTDNSPKDTTVLCGRGFGWLRVEDILVRINRNGRSEANQEVSGAAEAAV